VGLLCPPDRVPVSVEVFQGDTGDPKAFTSAVKKVVEQFGLQRITFVGDRGMITSARFREDLAKKEGLY
jgi:transposase